LTYSNQIGHTNTWGKGVFLGVNYASYPKGGGGYQRAKMSVGGVA